MRDLHGIGLARYQAAPSRENVRHNSGNSVAPHLHFHVTGGHPSLASNGLPYVVDSSRR